MKLKGIDGDPHKRWSMWFNYGCFSRIFSFLDFLISFSTSLRSIVPFCEIYDKISVGVKCISERCVSVVTAVTVLAGVVLLAVTAVTAVTYFEGQYPAISMCPAVVVIYPFVQ